MDFVLVMIAAIAFHYVKTTEIVPVVKSVTTVAVGSYALRGISVHSDSYAPGVFASQAVTVTEIVEMICCALQNFV